jgi:hypothetical protein
LRGPLKRSVAAKLSNHLCRHVEGINGVQTGPAATSFTRILCLETAFASPS